MEPFYLGKNRTPLSYSKTSFSYFLEILWLTPNMTLLST